MTVSELRRRIGNANWDKLKSFDMYSKIQEDYVARTGSGGAVSLLTFFILSVLFLSELSAYLNVDVVDHISVDTTLNQKLHIGLNISFPHLRCEEVSVDTVDSTGDNQVNIQKGLQKVELDADGSVSSGKFVAVEDCYPCYEGESESRKCCNTCDELREAYKERGKSYQSITYKAEQCNKAVGCQVHGDVQVSKVGGNVHVALGRSTIQNGKHLHEFDMSQARDGFNTSHTIHRLDFGGHVPGVDSPLAGTTKVVKQGSFMFHYYIKLVPTTFVSLSGESSATHQYAVTDTAKNVMVKEGELSGLPGVFFVYDFNPFMVEKREKRIPFSHFITSVCAILGGVFTVASVANWILHQGVQQLCGLAKRN